MLPADRDGRYNWETVEIWNETKIERIEKPKKRNDESEKDFAKRKQIYVNEIKKYYLDMDEYAKEKKRIGLWEIRKEPDRKDFDKDEKGEESYNLAKYKHNLDRATEKFSSIIFRPLTMIPALSDVAWATAVDGLNDQNENTSSKGQISQAAVIGALVAGFFLYFPAIACRFIRYPLNLVLSLQTTGQIERSRELAQKIGKASFGYEASKKDILYLKSDEVTNLKSSAVSFEKTTNDDVTGKDKGEKIDKEIENEINKINVNTIFDAKESNFREIPAIKNLEKDINKLQEKREYAMFIRGCIKSIVGFDLAFFFSPLINFAGEQLGKVFGGSGDPLFKVDRITPVIYLINLTTKIINLPIMIGKAVGNRVSKLSTNDTHLQKSREEHGGSSLSSKHLNNGDNFERLSTSSNSSNASTKSNTSENSEVQDKIPSSPKR